MTKSPNSQNGDVTGFKPIALSLFGGILLFGIFNLIVNQESFQFPNPFQKNISKSVYVFEYANDPVMGKYGVVYLEPKCLGQTKSIRKAEFDKLLSKGVKIISSIPRKTEVTVGNLYGECVGASYIVEGPENLLNKL
jgi:hypothetical protein